MATVEIKRSPIGNPEFVHTAGCYRVSMEASEHGLSVFVEEMSKRPGAYGVCTAITAENMTAFMQWMDDVVWPTQPQFVVVRERTDYAGNTNISREVYGIDETVRYYEDLWFDQTEPHVSHIREKLDSMRLGDSFAVGRGRMRETFTCIRHRMHQPVE